MSPPAQRDRWLALSLWGLGIVVAGMAACYQLRTFDTFFHVAAGRWIDQHGQVPRTDPFSFSHPGAPWKDHSWGMQWVMWRVYAWASPSGEGVSEAGAAGLVWLATVLSAALFAVGSSAARHNVAACLVAMWPFAAFRDVLCPRPQLFGLLALAAFLAWVRRFAATPPGRRVGLFEWAAFAAIHAAWVTSHGSHALALPLLGVALVSAAISRRGQGRGEVPRALLIATAVVATTTLALAPETFVLGTQHLESEFLRRYIPEWRPLTWADLSAGWPGWAAMATLAATLAGALRSLREGARDDPAWWPTLGMLAVLTALSLSSRRMLTLWTFGAMPLWLPLATAAGRGFTERLGVVPRRVAFAGVLVALGAGYQRAAARFTAGTGLEEERFPTEAVAYLRSHEGEGFARLFHAYNYGGFLMLARPSRGVLVDGRAVTVYPEAFLMRFRHTYEDPSTFPEFAQTFAIDSVLLPVRSRVSASLRQWLGADPGWTQVHEDRTAVLFRATATGL